MTDWKQRALAATRGSLFGAILSAATRTKIDAPCFIGRATMTSDGFVMCNFLDANQEGHMGAFVCHSTDLVRNTINLASHLRLDDDDRGALFEVVRNWISVDYSRDSMKALVAR